MLTCTEAYSITLVLFLWIFIGYPLTAFGVKYIDRTIIDGEHFSVVASDTIRKGDVTYRFISESKLSCKVNLDIVILASKPNGSIQAWDCSKKMVHERPIESSNEITFRAWYYSVNLVLMQDDSRTVMLGRHDEEDCIVCEGHSIDRNIILENSSRIDTTDIVLPQSEATISWIISGAEDCVHIFSFLPNDKLAEMDELTLSFTSQNGSTTKIPKERITSDNLQFAAKDARVIFRTKSYSHKGGFTATYSKGKCASEIPKTFRYIYSVPAYSTVVSLERFKGKSLHQSWITQLHNPIDYGYYHFFNVDNSEIVFKFHVEHIKLQMHDQIECLDLHQNRAILDLSDFEGSIQIELVGKKLVCSYKSFYGTQNEIDAFNDAEYLRSVEVYEKPKYKLSLVTNKTSGIFTSPDSSSIGLHVEHNLDFQSNTRCLITINIIEYNLTGYHESFEIRDNKNAILYPTEGWNGLIKFSFVSTEFQARYKSENHSISKNVKLFYMAECDDTQVNIEKNIIIKNKDLINTNELVTPGAEVNVTWITEWQQQPCIHELFVHPSVELSDNEDLRLKLVKRNGEIEYISKYRMANSGKPLSFQAQDVSITYESKYYSDRQRFIALYKIQKCIDPDSKPIRKNWVLPEDGAPLIEDSKALEGKSVIIVWSERQKDEEGINITFSQLNLRYSDSFEWSDGEHLDPSLHMTDIQGNVELQIRGKKHRFQYKSSNFDPQALEGKVTRHAISPSALKQQPHIKLTISNPIYKGIFVSPDNHLIGLPVEQKLVINPLDECTVIITIDRRKINEQQDVLQIRIRQHDIIDNSDIDSFLHTVTTRTKDIEVDYISKNHSIPKGVRLHYNNDCAATSTEDVDFVKTYNLKTSSTISTVQSIKPGLKGKMVWEINGNMNCIHKLNFTTNIQFEDDENIVLTIHKGDGKMEYIYKHRIIYSDWPIVFWSKRAELVFSFKNYSTLRSFYAQYERTTCYGIDPVTSPLHLMLEGNGAKFFTSPSKTQQFSYTWKQRSSREDKGLTMLTIFKVPQAKMHHYDNFRCVDHDRKRMLLDITGIIGGFELEVIGSNIDFTFESQNFRRETFNGQIFRRLVNNSTNLTKPNVALTYYATKADGIFDTWLEESAGLHVEIKIIFERFRGCKTSISIDEMKLNPIYNAFVIYKEPNITMFTSRAPTKKRTFAFKDVEVEAVYASINHTADQGVLLHYTTTC